MASARFRLGACATVDGTYSYGSYDAAIDTTASYYVKVELESTAGVSSIAVTIPNCDNYTIAASATPTVTTSQVTKTATFQMPDHASCVLVSVTINGGVDANGQTEASYTKALAAHVLTDASLRLLAVGETDEADRTYGYTAKINAAISAITAS